MQDDIAAYLSDVDENSTVLISQLSENKIRACFWFGFEGVADDCDNQTRIDNPAWNPIDTGWKNIAMQISEFVASVAAENIAQLYNDDRDQTTDNANAAALVEMFAIALEVISTRATETLYSGGDGEEMEETSFDSEVGEKDLPPLGDSYIDENDTLRLEGNSYIHITLHESGVDS